MVRKVKELSAQQIFEKVAMHLAKQGKKAKAGDKCVNYSADGLRCAVGCLIPIKTYTAGMATSSVIDQSLFTSNGVNIHQHCDLLIELRNIHDYEKVSRWAQKLRGLAKKHKLKVPEWLRLAK